ncbi:MAG: pyridoxamine 5'-phosphate oxidase family protein [Saprospiraceae bacterium]|nr:pyridoxamine 5'-phosphate oxidase family protein [Saprospiraceae bacterium]
MPAPITPDIWPNIRRNFRRGFLSSLHVAIGTVDAQGQPHVTPIGSFFLNRDGFTGFYFELFTRNIPQNATHNPRVCIMAVNSGKWYWLKSMLLGKFATPPMTKLYGALGALREATPEEMSRINRRLGRMKAFPGGQKLFGKMSLVREVHFEAYEEAKLPM